ncbi:MAG TPA: hypothetical protein VE178_14690 [Silvibacterium sp.]|nr:hypothetical protein [Silvibacterium sp.]
MLLDKAANEDLRGGPGPKKVAPRNSDVKDALLEQCEAMSIYALESGLRVPADTLNVIEEALNEPDSVALPAVLAAHENLSALIAPALPVAITLMHLDGKLHPRLSVFGPVPLIRVLLGIGLTSLVALILVSMSPEVNEANLRKDMLQNSGLTLLVCELFLLCAALVGSSFSAIFRVTDDVVKRVYDPRQDGLIWAQMALGAISGIVISQLIFALLNEGRPDMSSHVSSSLSSPIFEQPVLALLGGFAAPLVHRILTRLLAGAEAIFGSDTPPVRSNPTGSDKG